MSCVAVALVGAGGIAIAACADPAPTVATAIPGSHPPAPAGGWPAVGRWNSQRTRSLESVYCCPGYPPELPRAVTR
jgi:hypothetical protein